MDLMEAAKKKKLEAEEKLETKQAAAEAKKIAMAEAAELNRRKSEEKREAAMAAATARQQEAQAAVKKSKAEQVLQKAKPGATVSLFDLFGRGQAAEAEMDNKAVAPSSPSKPKRAVAQVRKVSVAPRGVPTISQWKQNRDGSISGVITGSRDFNEEEPVTTSPIEGEAIGGAVVQTTSGSK